MIVKTAVIDGTGVYRYRLGRSWSKALRPCLFVMLNPSTADAVEDDRTIRRCVTFAIRQGCGSLVVVNLFALRATDPKELKGLRDPVGPANDRHIKEAAAEGGLIILGWGTSGGLKERDREVLEILGDHGPLWCLGHTIKGHPKHPLYLKTGTELEDY